MSVSVDSLLFFYVYQHFPCKNQQALPLLMLQVKNHIEPVYKVRVLSEHQKLLDSCPVQR